MRPSLRVHARFSVPQTGGIKRSHGIDAIYGAFATLDGDARPESLQAWTCQMDLGEVTLPDSVARLKPFDGTSATRLPQATRKKEATRESNPQTGYHPPERQLLLPLANLRAHRARQR